MFCFVMYQLFTCIVSVLLLSQLSKPPCGGGLFLEELDRNETT